MKLLKDKNDKRSSIKVVPFPVMLWTGTPVSTWVGAMLPRLVRTLIVQPALLCLPTRRLTACANSCGRRRTTSCRCGSLST
eukprot:scaffold315093_cov32-Tisochrysis_lutea.AAC.3